jgi:hypothetical protein
MSRGPQSWKGHPSEAFPIFLEAQQRTTRGYEGK